MGSSQRILVLATSTGGGNWPPRAALTIGLHRAGHTVKCVGDTAVGQDLASAAVGVDVVQAEVPLGTFFARWRAAGASGPLPLREWADACAPAVRSLVRDFQPGGVVSELFTVELARLTKAACGVPYCFLNPGYYFGPDTLAASQADFAGVGQFFRAALARAVEEADLVLHATDPVFDPPPPSLPRHHHYIGPLMWERSTQAPAYLDGPGPPWVLVTLSSAPQEEETILAGAALRALAEFPVRTILTLTQGHPRDQLGDVPANARIELFVPHSEVLRRSCLLVSHAGHGIVTKALYHGVPMVLVPWGRDQPGVAARAAALGVAEVIPREQLTAHRLAAAIRRVLGTPRYQEKATRIASGMQPRDAEALARARIEELLEKT